MDDARLKAAARAGNIDLLYTVIQEDPDVLEKMDAKPFVDTPLHDAAAAGHVQFAAELMRLKPSFALKLNKQGFSPIHLALQHGQTGLVERLVDINKDLVRVNGREGLTPLHLVSQTGDTGLLAKFLRVCPDSIQDVTVRSETALHIAVKNKQYEALQFLLGWLWTNTRRGAFHLEATILNWKDEAGNTVLHISAYLNDTQALELLLKRQTIGLLRKTGINLNAKNAEKSTAYDVAGSEEMKSMLAKAGAKRGSSVTDAVTLPDILTSKLTIVDMISIAFLRARREVSEEQRNAVLVVLALVLSASFQMGLSPPGGLYQANAADNNSQNTNTSSLNSSTPTAKAGQVVMAGRDFLGIALLNTVILLMSSVLFYIVIPWSIVGVLLFAPVLYFSGSFLVSFKVISPTSSTRHLFQFLVWLFAILQGVVLLSCIMWPRWFNSHLRVKKRNQGTVP